MLAQERLHHHIVINQRASSSPDSHTHNLTRRTCNMYTHTQAVLEADTRAEYTTALRTYTHIHTHTAALSIGRYLSTLGSVRSSFNIEPSNEAPFSCTPSASGRRTGEREGGETGIQDTHREEVRSARETNQPDKVLNTPFASPLSHNRSHGRPQSQ